MDSKYFFIILAFQSDINNSTKCVASLGKLSLCKRAWEWGWIHFFSLRWSFRIVCLFVNITKAIKGIDFLISATGFPAILSIEAVTVQHGARQAGAPYKMWLSQAYPSWSCIRRPGLYLQPFLTFSLIRVSSLFWVRSLRISCWFLTNWKHSSNFLFMISFSIYDFFFYCPVKAG